MDNEGSMIKKGDTPEMAKINFSQKFYFFNRF